MKIALFSNYLNHHQLPFCQTMDILTNHQFVFVAFMPTPQFRIQLGYEEMNSEYPFVLRAYENKLNYINALKIANEYDLLIIGSAPESIIQQRIKKNLITFRYSERLFKTGLWKMFSPRGIANRIKNYKIYTDKNIYMLCASAYTSFDCMLIGSYIRKVYKWGYFPQYIQYDIDELWKKKKRRSILWVGRLINHKHPEYLINIAEKLKKSGYDFCIDIIGNGDKKEELKTSINEKRLEDYIHILGNMTPNDVRVHMEKAEIFLFTSDFNEGWGTVLNEAMNSGCAVVASHAIGSVPYLLKHGTNGLIYKNGNVEELYALTKKLLDNPDYSKEIGVAAYHTIAQEWNAEVAAERLLLLYQDLLEKRKSNRYKEGPCSKAQIITNWWK